MSYLHISRFLSSPSPCCQTKTIPVWPILSGAARMVLHSYCESWRCVGSRGPAPAALLIFWIWKTLWRFEHFWLQQMLKQNTSKYSLYLSFASQTKRRTNWMCISVCSSFVFAQYCSLTTDSSVTRHAGPWIRRLLVVVTRHEGQWRVGSTKSHMVILSVV